MSHTELSPPPPNLSIQSTHTVRDTDLFIPSVCSVYMLCEPYRALFSTTTGLFSLPILWGTQSCSSHQSTCSVSHIELFFPPTGLFSLPILWGTQRCSSHQSVQFTCSANHIELSFSPYLSIQSTHTGWLPDTQSCSSHPSVQSTHSVRHTVCSVYPCCQAHRIVLSTCLSSLRVVWGTRCSSPSLLLCSTQGETDNQHCSPYPRPASSVYQTNVLFLWCLLAFLS